MQRPFVIFLAPFFFLKKKKWGSQAVTTFYTNKGSVELVFSNISIVVSYEENSKYPTYLKKS